jgi:hypothetical protein
MLVPLPVTAPVPVTVPLTVQLLPTSVAQGIPDWPVLATSAMAWATVRLVDPMIVPTDVAPLVKTTVTFELWSA